MIKRDHRLSHWSSEAWDCSWTESGEGTMKVVVEFILPQAIFTTGSTDLGCDIVLVK